MRITYLVVVIAVLGVSSAPSGWAAGDVTSGSRSTTRRISDWSGPVVGAATVGLLALGNDREQRTGRYAIDALLATGAVVEVLKSTLRQSRPDAPNATDGMPSGHAAMAFTFATVLGNRHPKTRIFAYPAAAAVAWSRVDLRRHSWGQVIAGAGLGVLVGTASTRSHGGLLNGNVVDRNAPADAFTGTDDGGDFVAQRVLWSRQW